MLNISRARITVFCVILLLLLVPAAYGQQQAFQKKIKLGIIGPLTFVPGEGIVQGATMAIEEINKAGGVRVGKVMYGLEMAKADDNCLRSVSDAVSAMQRLITVDKVDFVIGGYHSESVFGQQDVMADYKKVFIDPGSASLRQPGRLAKDYNRYKYYFRIHENSAFVGKRMLGITSMVANKIKEEMGVKEPKVALLMEKMVWVDPIVSLCQEKLPQMGLEIVGVWRPSSMAADMTAEWTAIKASRAHMVLEVTSGPSGTIGPRQWGELQIPVALFGVNIQAMEGGHWEATNKKCNYEMTGAPVGPVEITPKTMPFYHAFEKKYGGYPLYIVANTYVAIFVLKDAIERAGTLDADAVVNALEKTDYIGVQGRIVFEPPNHEYPHMIRMGPGYVTSVAYQWIDGKQVIVWPDGRALLGDNSWVGIRHKGSKDYKLPPWVLEYWKGKKE